MIDHPSYTIILQIHTFNHPKIHAKVTISTANSPIFCSTKFTVKSMNWLECTIQNGGACCACAYSWRITTNILRYISKFLRRIFLKYYFMLTVEYAELKMIIFMRLILSFIKTIIPISENVSQYRSSAMVKRRFNHGC